MIRALNSAATGLRALSTQLDVISNNLANANNDGFKSSRVNFEDLMYQYKMQPGNQDTQGDIRPTGVAIGLGTRVAGTQLNFSQGAAVQTGRNLDIFIQGDGLFQVKVLPTQGDGVAYTRTGKFFVNPNGFLVTNSADGYQLTPPIQIPNNSTQVNISADGQVYATVAGQTNPTNVGQIQLAQFVNPQGLEQVGGNLYQQTKASGPPVIANPGTDALGTLVNGYVEASNVDPVKQLVDLIKTQRAFELNSQSIKASDQMLQTINNLRN